MASITSSTEMGFHIRIVLLSRWFFFRIILPHIDWVSDYFWIKTGRDWTLTCLGEQCFDTPRICILCFSTPDSMISLNITVSMAQGYNFSNFSLETKKHFISVPVSWDLCEVKPDPSPASSRPFHKVLLYHCLEIHSSIYQGFGDVSRLLKMNVICGERKET